MAKTRRPRESAEAGWPKRGEIYLVTLDPTVGHEIKKTRPALIVQNDTSNQYGAITMVAPITSTVRLPLSPIHVLLPADASTGLTVASVAIFNQIRAVDRVRLLRRLGAVSAAMMLQVDRALQVAFGISSSEP